MVDHCTRIEFGACFL